MTNDAPEVFPLGETIVTWTATDSSGNSSSGTQTISVVDTTSPTLTAPENLEVEAQHPLTQIEDFGQVIAEDISGISSITNDAPAEFPLGETIVTWTATDVMGNIILTKQTISVVDTTAPVIEAPSDFRIEASHTENNIIELVGVRVSDQVEVSSITNDAPASFPLGETIVTWTATDSSGNSSSGTQTISVVDTTAPILEQPDNVIFEAVNQYDNIIELPIIQSTDNTQISTVTNDAPTSFEFGVTIVNWTVLDISGNQSTLTQEIHVVDTTLPEIIAPIDIQAEATSLQSNIVEFGFAEASDQVEVSSITNDAPASFPLGETIVTWTATDSSGNSASTTQTISVVDTTAPEITTPQNITIDAVNTETILEIGFAIVDDIIDDSPIITNDAPDVFPLGETIVTWTSIDKFDNVSSSVQIISIQACGNSPSTYNMIVGSEDDDILIGTTLSDLIFANGGDDIISGNKGNDCIMGGDGNDIIFGNEGNDNISGENGNDVIKGQSGEDLIFGGFGLDMIDGGDDIDTCKIINEQNNDVIIKCESEELTS